MGIASSVVPEIKITPPDGELLYVNPYIGGKAEIDEYGNVQITHGYLRADWGSSYPQYDTISDVKANYIANQLDTSNVKSSWDGVVDNSYPPTYDVKEKADCLNLVYKCAYPLYNVTGGILYVNQGPDDSDTIAIDIGDSTDTSTEPSDLKNTKSNIRKIKPDINSELKRV